MTRPGLKNGLRYRQAGDPNRVFSMRLRAIVGVLLAAAIRVFAQETLLFDVNAYNPVPSPDGKLIAYDVTGRKLDGSGSGGFGRSNLLSQVEFSDVSGKMRWDPKVEGFLGEWLPDSSAIITYRDWRFALASPAKVSQSGSMTSSHPENRPEPAERATFLPHYGAFVWIEHADVGTARQRTVLQTKSGPIASLDALLPISALIVPSPDERYLAVGHRGPYLYEDPNLWIFDTVKETWTNLGAFEIHPDPVWDYIKPSWNPWFYDSHHPAFFSDSTLYVVSPDGKNRRKVVDATHAGLAVPSPDGSMVAFITSTPRPIRGGPT